MVMLTDEPINEEYEDSFSNFRMPSTEDDPVKLRAKQMFEDGIKSINDAPADTKPQVAMPKPEQKSIENKTQMESPASDDDDGFFDSFIKAVSLGATAQMTGTKEALEGSVKASPEVVLGGAIDAVQDIGNLGTDINNFFMEQFGIDARLGKLDFAEQIVPRSDSKVTGFVRDAASFLIPFGASLKGMKAANILQQSIGARTAIASFAADLVNVDPDEELLSDFLTKQSPLAGHFLYYFASDEDDTAFEKRLKDAALYGVIGEVGGLALEGVSELLGRVAKTYKTNRLIKSNQQKIREMTLVEEFTKTSKEAVEVPPITTRELSDDVVDIPLEADKYIGETKLDEVALSSGEFSGKLNTVHTSNELNLTGFNPLSEVDKAGRYDGGVGSTLGEVTYLSDNKKWPKMISGGKHYGVEANFEKAFVLTPDTFQKFMKITGGDHSLGNAPKYLMNQGYDGIIIKGFDDVIESRIGGWSGETLEEYSKAYNETVKDVFKNTNVDVLSYQDQIASFYPEKNLKVQKRFDYDYKDGKFVKEGGEQVPQKELLEAKRAKVSKIADQPVVGVEEAARRRANKRLTEIELPKFTSDEAVELFTKINKMKETPTYANRMNLHSIETTDDVKKMWASVSEITEDDYKIFSNKELMEQAEGYDLTYEEIIAQAESMPEEAIRNTKAKIMTTQLMEDVTLKARMFKEGLIASDDFFRQVQLAKQVERGFEKMGTQSGRAVQAWNAPIIPKASNIDTRIKFIQGLDDHFGDKSMDLVADELIKLSEAPPRTRLELLRDIYSNTFDYALGVRANWMLSNPYTLARNIVSTGGEAAVSTAETYMAVGIDALTGNRNGVTFREANQRVLGQIEGFKASIYTMWENTKNIAKGDLDNVVPIFRDTFDKFGEKQSARPFKDIPWNNQITPDGKVKEGMSRLQKSLVGAEYILSGRVVGDTMRGSDNVFKHMAYTGSLRGQVVSRGRQYALDLEREVQHLVSEKLVDAKEAAKMRKQNLKEVQKYMADIKAKPTDEMIKAAKEEARYLTFTNENTKGTLPRKIEELARINRAAKVLFPFVRTDINITMKRLERLPIAGLITPMNITRAKTGQIGQIIAKQSFGVGVLGTLAYTGGTQGWLTNWTGSLPLNQELRAIAKATGHQENSITIGGYNIPLRPLDPALTVLGTARDISLMYQTMADAYGRDDREVMDIAADLTGAFGTAMMRYFRPEFMVGLTSAVMSAEHGNVTSLQHFTAQIANTFVPYNAIIRQTRKWMSDEEKAVRAHEGFSGTANLIWQYFNKSYLSGEGLPPRRNILGEPLKPTGTFASLVESDPVIEEIGRLSKAYGLDNSLDVGYPSLIISKPNPSVRATGTGQTRKLKLNEYDLLQQYAAGVHKDSAKKSSLRSILTEVINNKKYRNSSDFIRTQMIRKAVSKRHSLGLKEYMAKHELDFTTESVKDVVELVNP